MSTYSDIQNALTERRARLSQIVWAEATRVFPSFQNRLASIGHRRELESLLAAAIRREMDEPFSLEVIDKGNGELSIRCDPEMTDAEKAAEQAEIARTNASFREAEIEADKRRAAEHPKRAHVPRLNGGADAYVSISGMISDLRHWQAPPDLLGEEEAGFRQAVHEVVNYLRARERLSKP